MRNCARSSSSRVSICTSARTGDVIDGFDMDWEFPGVGEGTRKEDKQNFTLLMKEFRRQLDDLEAQKKRSYLLTAAMPAGTWLVQIYELKELSPVLDWFNLMTYDFHGVWSKADQFHRPALSGER